MIETKQQFNPAMKELKEEMKKKDASINRLRELMLDLHGFTHSSTVSEGAVSPYDELWNKRKEIDYTSFTVENIYSIAWHFWHAARIEDIACSYFISKENEILYESSFDQKLRTSFFHTGNCMDYSDMAEFNKSIDIEQLHRYKCQVGKRTRSELGKINMEKLKSKVDKTVLPDILDRGSVSKDDKWLIDFWEKKKIFGIVTMPLMRNPMTHLNSSIRIAKL